ncbi:uncharacterized protein [Haliotis asinina]|uniref:uncharacterized protein isoform X1 n=1 Tax=Haliotis asinina TaxID=109174 RepID=UPI00353225BF
MKRMQHLSIWILLLLFELTSCANDAENVTVCANETASFVWYYEVPPFFAVEWFFETTRIAETLKADFSPESLSINGIYKSRFHLLDETEKFGFNLTNVTWDDRGEYKCKLILQSTHIPHELNKILIVQAPDCQQRRRALGEEEPESGEEQPPASDSPGHVHPAAVAVPVVIGVICVVIVVVVIKRKGFPATGIQHGVLRAKHLTVESRSELPELEKLEDEIKSPAADENGMGSQILMKDTEA